MKEDRRKRNDMKKNGMKENSILVIDDDLILLKTAEEILSEQYNVSVAKSGVQALNLLKKNIIPDLILLDIDMPEIDGYETLEKIKKINGCELIPIIFLTGFSEMDYEVKGLKAGAVDYIVKPFVKEILLARVERHLERYNQRQKRKSIELSERAEEVRKKLTPTEWKIALAIAEGMENKEIAESMHYSYGYVKNLIAKIFVKLDIEKRRELQKLMNDCD